MNLVQSDLYSSSCESFSSGSSHDNKLQSTRSWEDVIIPSNDEFNSIHERVRSQSMIERPPLYPLMDDDRTLTKRPSSVMQPSFPEELPLGWEVAFNKSGKAYYINHADHSTTFQDPRMQRQRSYSTSTLHGPVGKSDVPIPPPPPPVLTTDPSIKKYKDATLNQLRHQRFEDEKSFKSAWESEKKHEEQIRNNAVAKQMAVLKDLSKDFKLKAKVQQRDLEKTHKEDEKRMRFEFKAQKKEVKSTLENTPLKEMLSKEISQSFHQRTRLVERSHRATQLSQALKLQRHSAMKIHSEKIRLFLESTESRSEVTMALQTLTSKHLYSTHKSKLHITQRTHELDRAEMLHKQEHDWEIFKLKNQGEEKDKYKKFKKDEKMRKKEQECLVRCALRNSPQFNKKDQADKNQVENEKAWEEFWKDLEVKRKEDEENLKKYHQDKLHQLRTSQDSQEQFNLESFIEEHRRLVEFHFACSWQAASSQHKQLMSIFEQHQEEEKKLLASHYETMMQHARAYLEIEMQELAQREKDKITDMYRLHLVREGATIDRVERKHRTAPDMIQEKKDELWVQFEQFKKDQDERYSKYVKCLLEDTQDIKSRLLRDKQKEELELLTSHAMRAKELENFFRVCVETCINQRREQLEDLQREYQIYWIEANCSSPLKIVSRDAEIEGLSKVYERRIEQIDKRYAQMVPSMISDHAKERFNHSSPVS